MDLLPQMNHFMGEYLQLLKRGKRFDVPGIQINAMIEAESGVPRVITAQPTAVLWFYRKSCKRQRLRFEKRFVENGKEFVQEAAGGMVLPPGRHLELMIADRVIDVMDRVHTEKDRSTISLGHCFLVKAMPKNS